MVIGESRPHDPEPRFGTPRALFEWNEHWVPYFAWTGTGRVDSPPGPQGPYTEPKASV
jgi:hypothetical protein